MKRLQGTPEECLTARPALSHNPKGRARSNNLPEGTGEKLWFRSAGHSWWSPSRFADFIANWLSPLEFCVSGLLEENQELMRLETTM